MTIWCPDLSLHPGPRYKALAEAINTAIDEGLLEAGSRLPPQRDLAYRLGVTVGTVSRAYTLAEQRGLVKGEVGRGTFVRTGPGAGGPSGEIGEGFSNALIDGESDLIKLTVNSQPDTETQRLLAANLNILAETQPVGELLAYAPRVGFEAHRVAAADWASRVGVGFSPSQTLITGGAHQAITVALSGLTRPGDTVLTEQLVYSGLKRVAMRLGLTLKGVALDHEGIRPDALDAACHAIGAKVLLVNPTTHNPTTATMSEERRRAIVAVAERHDLILIEDDVYGQLDRNRAPTLAELAPARTIYVTAASKIVAPNLRFGVLIAPEALFDRLADAQSDMFLTCPPLMAAVFTQWLNDGTADRMIERQRIEARARQAIATQCLAGIAYDAKPFSYHVWLPLPEPWRSSTFTEALRGRGVAVDPGYVFAVGPLAEPHAVRLSLSAARNRDRLRRALHLVSATLASGPIVRRDTI